MKIAVHNVDKIKSKIDTLNLNLDKVLIKSMKDVGELIKEDAKDVAPFDTGALKGSIQKRIIKNDANDISVEVYSNKEYAIFQELGTGIRGAIGNEYKAPLKGLEYSIDHNGNAPKPFLYLALKVNRDYIKKIILGDIREEVRKHKKK